jgi:hypothetical protein
MADRQTMKFRGRVLPESVQVSIDYTPTVSWKADELQYDIEIVCRIEKSVVDIECVVSDWRPEYYPDIYRRAFDICQAKVDVIAFQRACGLTVLLETFEAPDGNVTPIVPTSSYLERICTAFSLERGYAEVCEHVLRRPLLFMAMRELITAISVPYVAPVECARAIDRLKNLIATPGSKDKAAWQQLRDTLRIDEAYLKYISDASANPRHGQPGHTPGAITTEATRRAWVVMNRYLEYLVRGEKPLDAAEFPVIDQ